MRCHAPLHRWLAAVFLGCGLAAAAAAQEAQTAVRKRPPPLAMSAAFSPGGELWIVALDEQRRLFVQQSGDEGRSWSEPRLLATGDDTVAADGENRPKLAFGPHGVVIVSYTQPLSKPYTGQVRMLRSHDGGRSFSAPFTVHADRQLITHRFESVAFDAKGTLHTLWIDKRDLAAGTSTRGAAIYRNESTDGGRSFGPDIRLAAHSCECCRIALAPAPDGGIVAMWRHVFDPNERDHAFAHVAAESVERTEPMRASHDRWAIDACPHHGPGLAPAAGGGYHAVWFGVRAGEARVRAARLGPDGSPRSAAVTLPDDRAEHADVASAGRHLAIVWRSFDGQATRWRAWLSSDDGSSFILKELGQAVDDNDHPRLAVHGRRIIALWRTTKGVRVERLFP